MVRVTFGEGLIASAGYDALMMQMEIEFRNLGFACVYYDVSEDVWYGLKFSRHPDDYFHRNVRGKYREERII